MLSKKRIFASTVDCSQHEVAIGNVEKDGREKEALPDPRGRTLFDVQENSALEKIKGYPGLAKLRHQPV